MTTAPEQAGVPFGPWVRRQRQQLDLTQAQLAARVACSVALIRKIESDERRASKEIAEALAEALAIGPADRAAFLQAARRIPSAHPGAVEAEPTPAVATPLPSPLSSTNLPPVTGELIGRAGEIAALLTLIQRPTCRLLTIVGVGGMGKTRVGLAMAEQARLLFPDGIYFVPLAPICDGQLIIPAIADALGLALPASGDLHADLQGQLQGRTLLLLLDNAEHLLDEVAQVVATLLRTSAVKVLITSRERLNLQREWIFDLQGLAVPPAQWAELADGGSLLDYSAVDFFVECARRVDLDFDWQAHQAALVRICRLVEGLPLGIELAAAWVHVLSCTEIAQEIAQTIDFLSINQRDVPPRHRSIRAAIDHSWALLTDAEQQTLQRLAVFRGGFTREGAQAIAQANLPRLTALFDKSLVQRVSDQRYDLHELVRQYAAAKLAQSEQSSAPTTLTTTAQRHALYFVELAETARQQWHGPDQPQWAERLQQELDNFRAVQSWITTAGDLTLAPRLANAIWRFWEMRGYVAEGRRWITQALAKATAQSSLPESNRVRTQLLYLAGLLARVQGEFTQAREYLLQSLALREAQGDQAGMAAVLVALGNVAMFMGDYGAAEEYFAANLAIQRQRNDIRQIYITYNNLAIVAMYQGNYGRARELHEAVLAYHRQQGTQDGIAGALGNLGDVLRYQGEYAAAAQALQESLALFEQLQSVQGKVVTLNSLGRLALAVGQLTEAQDWFVTSLRLYTLASDKIAMLDNLEGMAQVATRRQQAGRAICLYGAAAALHHQLHIPLPPIDDQEQAGWLAHLRTSVPADAFATAWAQGQRLTLDGAISYALSGQA